MMPADWNQRLQPYDAIFFGCCYVQFRGSRTKDVRRAIGHGNKRTQQLEFQHAIDPLFRSIILSNIISIISDDLHLSLQGQD
jgi:hypothetical protein